MDQAAHREGDRVNYLLLRRFVMTSEPMAHPLDVAREQWDALLNRYIHIEAAARYALTATSWDEAQATLREALKDDGSSDIDPILDGDLNPL